MAGCIAVPLFVPRPTCREFRSEPPGKEENDCPGERCWTQRETVSSWVPAAVTTSVNAIAASPASRGRAAMGTAP